MNKKKSISLKTVFIIWLLICYIYNFVNIITSNLERMNLLTFFREKPLDVLVCMIF